MSGLVEIVALCGGVNLNPKKFLNFVFFLKSPGIGAKNEIEKISSFHRGSEGLKRGMVLHKEGRI